MSGNLTWQQDDDGVVTLTMDAAGRSANTLTDDMRRELHGAIVRLAAEQDELTGVIITSAKKTFLAGADLTMIDDLSRETLLGFCTALDEVKADFRTLETLRIPVVAAINGAALGGGLELALACHHRIALDNARSEIGLPEVMIGALPAAGGVVRTVRMFGIQKALTEILLPGRKFRPEAALQVGLVDALAATGEELIAEAKAWIRANPAPKQPWDEPGHKVPGGTPANPKFMMNLPAFPANLRKQLKGQPMPAPRAIMAAAVESTQVDVDSAFRIETRYLGELLTNPITRNMIEAVFFDLQTVTKADSIRPAGYPATGFTKVVVLGAGMMGAGIAHVEAMAGLQVVLKDVSVEAAERGKAYSQRLLDKAVARGRMTPQRREEVLARIIPTDSYDDCAGADLVIEAVFEDLKLKHQVLADVQRVVAPDALLASNTSTLPITELAKAVDRPQRFIGMHFISPVERMQPVEIIRGTQTDDAAVAKAIDNTLAIKKLPAVVNDCRGFFGTRVFMQFVLESVGMLGEGVRPSSIEQAASQAGYPAAALQLADELSLTLPMHIIGETKKGMAADGETYVPTHADAVFDAMVNTHGRKGKAAGAGFYDYTDGKRRRLWPGLTDAFNAGSANPPFEDLKERLLFLPALESVHCFDEGIIDSVPHANAMAILGFGYPVWTGGVIRFINQYEGGVAGFVARAQQLADRYGRRFTPPQSLLDHAAAGTPYAGVS